MAKAKIKKDNYGLYLRYMGCVFRPDFPHGYDPRNPILDEEIKENDMVSVSYKGAGACYCKVKWNNVVLYWMNHGSYIVPDGDNVRYIKSHNCYLNNSTKSLA